MELWTVIIKGLYVGRFTNGLGNQPHSRVHLKAEHQRQMVTQTVGHFREGKKVFYLKWLDSWGSWLLECILFPLPSFWNRTTTRGSLENTSEAEHFAQALEGWQVSWFVGQQQASPLAIKMLLPLTKHQVFATVYHMKNIIVPLTFSENRTCS